VGVQEEPAGRFQLRVAVKGVARDGMAHAGQMHANLVRPSRSDADSSRPLR